MRQLSGLARVVAGFAIAVCVVAGCTAQHHPAEPSVPSSQSSSSAQYPTTPPPPTSPPTAAPAKYDNFTCNHDNHNSAITAYNADGSTRWSHPLIAAMDQSELISNGADVFIGSNGAVAAYRAIDGVRLWQTGLGANVYGLWLFDGAVIANLDQIGNSRIISLDPATGAVRWIYSVPGDGFLGNPAVTSDGAMALTVISTKSVVVLDLATGKLRWTNADKRLDTQWYPSAAKGLILFPETDHRLVARDSHTGAIRWSVPDTTNSGSVLVDGDVGLLVPRGSGPDGYVAYSLNNGRAVWHFEDNTLNAPEVTVTPSGFVFQNNSPRFWWALIDPQSGRQLWRSNMAAIDPDHLIQTADRADFAAPGPNSILFADRRTGHPRQVAFAHGGYVATTQSSGVYATNENTIARVSPSGITWQANLPESPMRAPLPLADGGVAIQTVDPYCGAF